MRLVSSTPIEPWQDAYNRRLEVARIPPPVVPIVRRQLQRLAYYLVDSIEPFELKFVMNLIAGIAHQVSCGAKAELAEDIRARAKLLKESSDRDDLLAAAELEDLAQTLTEELLCEAGKQ